MTAHLAATPPRTPMPGPEVFPDPGKPEPGLPDPDTFPDPMPDPDPIPPQDPPQPQPGEVTPPIHSRTENNQRLL